MTEISEDILFDEEDTMKNKFLTFALGKEQFGIEIKYVTEIIGIQSITGVPDLEDYVIGIINLRGKIIPVMDVRLRFYKEQRQYDDRTCVIIIDIEELSVGLIVDRVCEVLTIREEDIVEPPSVDKGHHHKYIKNIGKVENEVVLLLDCDKLLGNDDLEKLSQIA